MKRFSESSQTLKILKIKKRKMNLIKSQIAKKSTSFGGNFEKKKRNIRYMMTESIYFNNQNP